MKLDDHIYMWVLAFNMDFEAWISLPFLFSTQQTLISTSNCTRSEKEILKFISDLLDRAKTLWADVEINV